MQAQDNTVHLAATCPVCGTSGYEANSPCPLHAAAPGLLAALEPFADLETLHFGVCRYWQSTRPAECDCKMGQLRQAARVAIAAAKGEVWAAKARAAIARAAAYAAAAEARDAVLEALSPGCPDPCPDGSDCPCFQAGYETPREPLR